MKTSLEAGALRHLTSLATICDGIAVKSPSAMTLAHAKAFVDDVVTVNDEETGHALVTVLERLKSVIEPSAAAALAAVMANKFPRKRRSGPTVVCCRAATSIRCCFSTDRAGLSVAGRYWPAHRRARSPGSLAVSPVISRSSSSTSCGRPPPRRRRSISTSGVAITVETRGQDHRRTALKALRDRGWPCVPQYSTHFAAVIRRSHICGDIRR